MIIAYMLGEPGCAVFINHSRCMCMQPFRLVAIREGRIGWEEANACSRRGRVVLMRLVLRKTGFNILCFSLRCGMSSTASGLISFTIGYGTFGPGVLDTTVGAELKPGVMYPPICEPKGREYPVDNNILASTVFGNSIVQFRHASRTSPVSSPPDQKFQNCTVPSTSPGSGGGSWIGIITICGSVEVTRIGGII